MTCRLAIIEQENRLLKRQINDVQDRMRTAEQQSTKVQEEEINPLLQPRTGHRRVPGLMSNNLSSSPEYLLL